MTEILVEYTFLKFNRRVKGKMPERWDELTENQFIALSRVIEGKDPDFRFLSEMTGIRRSLLKRLTPYELLRLSDGMDFIGKAGNCHSDFILRQLPGLKLTAPKAKLSGITFSQFIFADAYYNDWCRDQQQSTLNKFIACLYLALGEAFSHENIEKRILPIGAIDLDIRKAIVLNYSLVSVWLEKAYPLIFVEKQEGTKQQDPPKPLQSGWLNLFESMVGEDLINRDRYAGLPLHSVLKYLTRKYKENARR